MGLFINRYSQNSWNGFLTKTVPRVGGSHVYQYLFDEKEVGMMIVSLNQNGYRILSDTKNGKVRTLSVSNPSQGIDNYTIVMFVMNKEDEQVFSSILEYYWEHFEGTKERIADNAVVETIAGIVQAMNSQYVPLCTLPFIEALSSSIIFPELALERRQDLVRNTYNMFKDETLHFYMTFLKPIAIVHKLDEKFLKAQRRELAKKTGDWVYKRMFVSPWLPIENSFRNIADQRLTMAIVKEIKLRQFVRRETVEKPLTPKEEIVNFIIENGINWISQLTKRNFSTILLNLRKKDEQSIITA